MEAQCLHVPAPFQFVACWPFVGIKQNLPPVVLATLSHRACNYFILYFPDDFCHTEPPGELYFMVLIIPDGFWHTELPGEFYFLVLCLFIPGGICHTEPPEYGIRVPHV